MPWLETYRNIEYQPVANCYDSPWHTCPDCKHFQRLVLGLGIACACLTALVALAVYLRYYGCGY